MKSIISFIFIFIFLTQSFAQDNKVETISTNTEREEIQRYFGYEDLLSSYLTLPLDVSLNTNERGYFLDIGFLILILLPILLVWNRRFKDPIFGFIIILGSLTIQLIYIATGFIFSPSSHKISSGQYSIYAESNNSFLEDILSQFYIIGNKIIEPITKLIDTISGPTDYFSYPLLCLLFVAMIVTVKTRLTKPRYKFVSLIFITFSFFWLILSSGILWYGYLGLILGIIIIIKLLAYQHKYLKVFGTTIIVCWLVIAIVSRISFVQNFSQTKENTGKYIMQAPFFQRSLGLINTQSTVDRFYPGLSNFSQTINSDNKSELIYTIGTGLDYFFDRNQSKIFKDNQLRMFNVVFERYKSKEKIIQALKLAGFKYLIVDLNTHTLDRTPERTLTTKFQRLMGFIANNNDLILLGTDRKVLNKLEKKYDSAVFGDIVQSGTYAVYQIM